MRRVAAGWGEKEFVPAALFLLAFTVGVVAVLVGKVLGASALVTVLTPAIIIGGYASLVLVPGFKLRADQTGDNSYYLGFLLTLVSLAWALYEFDATVGSAAIVQSFGVAVSSTIIGVFVRVLLNLAQIDPHTVERNTRLALADAANNLRDEMQDAALELAHFRKENQKAAVEELKEIRQHAVKQMELSATGVDKALRQSSERISQAVVTWGDNARQFNDQAEKLVHALSGLSAKLDAVRAPADIIDAKLSGAGQALASLTQSTSTAVAGLATALEKVEQAASVIEQAGASARDLVLLSLEQTAALNEASTIVGSAQTQIDRLTSGAEQFSGAITQAGAQLGSDLGQFSARLDAQLSEARQLARPPVVTSR